MNPTIIIIVLNWNGFTDTLELIDSLDNITYDNYHILILDNNSDGNDFKNLRAIPNKRVRVIESEENLGFTGGNNLAIKLALNQGAEFVLLINNDTIVEPDFLDKLVNKIASSRTIGITAPIINYYEDQNKIWSTGGKISRLRSSGFSVSNKSFRDFNSKVKKNDFVSGCCMLIRKEVFETVGYFDENYFLYIEDTDLCFRTSKSGYQIITVPDSVIYHKVATSTRKTNSVLPLYYATRNRLYFAKKNFSTTFSFSFFYIFITMLFKSFYWLLSGKLNRIRVVKKAVSDFLSGRMGRQQIINNK